ncbi:MAG: DUF6599 family protein [Acidobacteriota bacterium]
MRRTQALEALLLAASVLSAAIPSLCGAPAQENPPRDAPPAGWVRSASPRIFSGEALYDHIDGGAETFLELGFRTCTVSRFESPGDAELVLESYEMQDPAAALGIYLMQCGRETPDPSLSERNTAGKTQVRAVKGRFYFVATTGDAGGEARAALLGSMRAALAGTPAEPAPDCLSWIPEDGRKEGSLRIARGGLGLQASLPFADSDILLLAAGRATAVSADYPSDSGWVIRLAAVYETPQAARSGARRLAEALGWEPPASEASVWTGQTPDHRVCRVAVAGPRLDLEAGPPAAP